VWVGEFRPALNGLTLSWPSWMLWVQGQAYEIAAETITFAANAEHDQAVR